MATILINFLINTSFGIGMFSLRNFVSNVYFHNNFTKVFQRCIAVYSFSIHFSKVLKFKVHHLNMASVGVIPHLLLFPFSFLFGAIGDYLLKRKMISTVLARKSFSIISKVMNIT